MAPEVVSGNDYHIKAVIFSLDLIMEEIFNIDMNVWEMIGYLQIFDDLIWFVERPYDESNQSMNQISPQLLY
jgi:hypothetical protein